MNNVILAVNGSQYDGWKDVTIKMGLKSLSGSFNLSITDNWTSQREPWIISPQSECKIFIDKDPVITGYTDSLDPSYDKSSHTISVAGRDKTADLVDCSTLLKRNQFQNLNIYQIAKLLAAPHGLTVVMNGSPGGPFLDTKIQEGDTGFCILDRLARIRGYLVTTDGLGKIIITRPSSARATTKLEQGVNILKAAASYNDSDRHSDYVVKAQTSAYSAELSPLQQFGVKATAKDAGVKRYRPLLIIAEQGMTQGEAQVRANWEATVRSAKASTFNVSTTGWRQADGTLWRPNQVVSVESKHLGFSGELLVVGVTLNKSDAGTISTLQLERSDAYKPEPVVKASGDPIAAEVRREVSGSRK